MTAAHKLASYADVLAAPADCVAELIGGQLHTHPRPAPRHANAASAVAVNIGAPFGRGRGGPGGWVILIEPELHLGADVIVPDVAGWRRERLPVLPDQAHIDTPPDWVCEVLSPGTASFDRTVKMPRYESAGVCFLWLIDPIEQTLEVYRRLNERGPGWLLLATYTGSEPVHPVPFDALPFALGDLWAV